jgi:predicted DNA-binding transcriptional regulator YafY
MKATSSAKRPNNLEAVTIALKILHLIPRKPRAVDAPSLLAALKEDGIDRGIRTVERHLENLCDQFKILCDDTSKPYRYSWPKEARALDIPILSEQDALLLMLAKQQLQHLLPASLNKSMTGFFEQADYALNAKPDSTLAKEWLSKVRVVSDSQTQPLIPPSIDPEIFETVSNALYNNRMLNLRYRNSSGQESDINVMPLGLAQQEQRFYLVCRYDGYDNERNLALHRIISAKASFTFDRPINFNLAQYDIDGRFAFGEGHKVKLMIRINKYYGSHLIETKLSHDQTHREVGEDLEITATVVDSARLEWWLRGFGDAISHTVKVPIQLYDEAHEFVLAKRKASPSALQRTFAIGYQRGSQIIEIMEAAGIVSAMHSNGKRDILVD